MRNIQSNSNGPKKACLIPVILLLAATGWAANGRTNTNTAQAVLRIQVNVVPTVLAAQQQALSRPSDSAVAYLVPTVALNQETSTQEMLVGTPQHQLPCSQAGCNATLRTTTVVAR